MPRNRSGPSSPLRRRVADQFRALVGALATSARAVEARTGLTNAQLHALRALGQGDGITAGTLAERMAARPNALSPVLRRLEQRKLIIRRRDPRDRRRVLLALGSPAADVLADAPAPPAEQLVAAIRTMPDDQLVVLTRIMTTLLKRMDVAGPDGMLLFEMPDA